MYSESQRLEEEIHSLQEKLKTYPDGKFYCTRDGNHYKRYHSEGSKQTYIPKSNRLFAQQLAEKKYLSKKLDELIHEKRAIDFYLRHHSDNTSEQWFAEHSEYHELLAPCSAILSHPVATYLKICLGTTELQQKSLKIVIVEFEGI